MQNWGHAIVVSEALRHEWSSTTVGDIWEKMDTWYEVQQFGKEGYEMVSAFATSGRSGETENIVFVFNVQLLTE